MKKIILIIVIALMMSAFFSSPVFALTGSFVISGTVFYDQNGNGWHDVDETKYISSERSCSNGIIVSGTKIKVVAKKGKNSKTNYYYLDYCGKRTKGKYAGQGVYYDTKAYEVGTKLTIELIVPNGWKATLPNPIEHEVDGEYFSYFAMTKEVPVNQQPTEKVVENKNLNANIADQNIQQAVPLVNQENKIQQQMKNITQEQDIAKENIVVMIDKIKRRSGIKKFLFGSDYKNLGELRSEMVKIKNRIEQLNKLIDKSDNDQDKAELQNQIQILEQEQANTNNFITQNEKHFSLFGWAVKLFQ